MNTQKFADETAKQTLFHYKGAHCKFDNLGVNVKWHEGSIFAKLFITWLLLYYSPNVWNKYDNHYNKRPSGHIAHLSNNSHNFDNISLDSLRFFFIKSYVKNFWGSVLPLVIMIGIYIYTTLGSFHTSFSMTKWVWEKDNWRVFIHYFPYVKIWRQSHPVFSLTMPGDHNWIALL